MRGDYGYIEEGLLGKPRDLGLLKRLLPLLRPYRRLLIGSVTLVLMMTLINLTLPYLSKVAIDRYIVPVPAHTTPWPDQEMADERRYLTVDLRREQVRQVVERFDHLFERRAAAARIAYADLARLPAEDLRRLRQDQITGLGWVVLFLLVLVVADFAFTFLQRVIMERAGHRVMHDLRMRLFEHIQQQRLTFFTRQPVARLVTRMTNDVQNMHELFTTFASMVFRDIFMLLGIAAVLLALNWRIALAVFALLPVVVWAAVRFSRRAREVFRALRVKVAQINGHMAETIEGIRTIQTFGRQERNFARFADLNNETLRLGMREIHVFALFMPLIEVLGLLALAVLVLFGGLQVLDNRVSLGVLVAALTYVRMFFRPIRDLAENYNILQNAMASAERIFSLLDTDTRLPRPAEALDAQDPRKDRLQSIALERVSFAYTPGEPVLREVSFTAQQGQTVALVGPTGAGKTSVLNLLQRFYDPDSGRIRINGVDLRHWDIRRLRGMTALVTQEPVLFSATLRENIFARPDQADEATVTRILQAAHCEALVQRLPLGLDTHLEKGGASLSSGERQLITIARALARDAQLILLDEATSYIDSQTEAVIHKALHNLIAGRTCVLVAHRLSTARSADRILVLHQGRVAEAGDHRQLMERRGLYWRLHRQEEKRAAD
ncbi:ABC transporter ATP-binding protein [Desulfatitalea alkaliphila]|uniref:ABC transporter ATP-binding protein/permease n=1 Tax=Desulfatitalea alkaliphila TaxID=2929485 RepID=A0AA41R6W5_9BACT|nr:ABC transporter ATP-binding protein [Desulfatitalea alkaliphila]MCJ8500168.1 ABC transporter ATP-binding protein/permease [Desulfatitalea alkaliphila]